MMKKVSVILKITGGLMMLASLIHFMFGLTFLHFFSTSVTMGTVPRSRVPLLFSVLVVAAVSSVTILITGIIALINSTEPLKASQTVRWGAAGLVLGIASEILVRLFGYESSVIYTSTGIIIPVIHLIIAVVFLVYAQKGYRLHGTEYVNKTK